jgi:putative CocE/NonD family hydrolase
MVKIAACWPLAVLLGLLCGCQSLADHYVQPHDGVRPATDSVRIEHGAAMTTADGVKLVADIYLPQSHRPSPTILVRIPFSRSFQNDLGAAAIARFWASHGYNVVIQGSRGRFKSGGEYYPLRDERSDGIATLKWLWQQPWFDGRLGMWGGSVFGYTQWVLADQQDPGPSALMIQICSTSVHEMFYPGGAFSLESALFWAVRSRGQRDQTPSFRDLARGFNGFPLIDADDRVVSDIGFFDDWVRHSGVDDYWKAIDGDERARTIRAPVLLMAGWSDPFLPGQLRDFNIIRRQADPRVAAESRLIIGPWTHADPIRFPDGTTAGPYRQASLAPSLPWFDHVLEGRALDATLASPVRIYVMGENIWRDEQEWPLARARPTAFYFRGAGPANSADGDGRLSPEPPDAAEPPDSFTYDPQDPVPSRGGAMLGPRAGMAPQNDVETRRDVLVYSSTPLTQDLEVTGPVSATLHIGTTAPSTDFTVKLVDVDPAGKAYNVTDGILRRAYPAAEEKPAPTYEIKIDLWPTSMLFRKGHRIRVEVSSSNFPRYDRNPNTGRDISTETSPVTAMQTVYHSPGRLSHILLPVIPREAPR